jgi:hypothetical protein
MAIKSNYDFKGLEIVDAYIRVGRLWGSSRENWNSLIEVCIINTIEHPEVPEVPEIPEVPEVVAEDGTIITPAVPSVPGVDAVPAYTEEVKNIIDTFNLPTDYVSGEDAYISIYKELNKKYPNGVEV